MSTQIQFTFPSGGIDALVKERTDKKRNLWEKEFDKNHKTFAKKISEGIAKQIFENIEATLKDPYIQLPNKNNTLLNYFSLEIVKPSIAKKILEWSQESSNLPPFNEWIQRFTNENQKISEDEISLSSGPFRRTEKEKGIDREYFQDMMSIVGRIVETNLSEMFLNFHLQPGNLSLKFKVTWHRTDDQFLSNPSGYSYDNSIGVEVWMEDKKSSQTQAIQSMASNTIELNRESRRKMQKNKYIFQIAGTVALIAVIVYMLFRMEIKKV